jgi:hypothetical protein
VARSGREVPDSAEIDLSWVNEILWGPLARVEISRNTSPRDAEVTLETFGPLPSAGSPHLLVPMGSPKAAHAVLRSYTDARARIRAAAALIGTGMRAGVAQRLFRDRIRIVVPTAGRSESSRPPIKEHLQEILGRRDIEIAVRMGGARPNRKPVLQIVSGDGEALGYAKIGWNDLTRRLVKNESDVLRRLTEAAEAPRSFSFPRIIHAESWEDLEVLVVAPVPHQPWYRPTSQCIPSVEATQEISSLNGEAQLGTLAGSRYWKRTQERLEVLAPGVPSARHETLRGMLDLLEQRHGDVELRFGTCHGDWTSWNMANIDGRLWIWDWERSGDLIPTGLDAAHFDFDVAVKFRRKSPRAAVRHVLSGRGPLLGALRSPRHLTGLLVTLDLFEMVLRFEEARQGGIAIDDRTYYPALRAAVFSEPLA